MQQTFLLQILLLAQHVLGHHYSHHQELQSIIQWLLPVVFRAVVFKLVWCGAEGYVSGLQDAAASSHNLQWNVFSIAYMFFNFMLSLHNWMYGWPSPVHSSELLLWTLSSNMNPQHPTVTPHNTEILAGVILGNFNALLGRFQLKHDGTWAGKWRVNQRMERVASTLHTTLERGVSSITTTDAHTSAASSRLNWRPRQFKWIRPFPQRRNLVSACVPSHFKHSLTSVYF